ncbi:NAD(P)-binding protein [Phaeosphaeriaceae sp. SRC1lsM3a]|nr:NAD(P)-binding protein [Stagonospora sp. SRC1lsM3a]
MAPIKVGVLGYGFAAKSFHIPFIRAIPDYEVAAILQRAEAPADPRSAPKGSHCTVDFPEIAHYRKAEELFANPGIAFVVVATHADTHIFFAEQALQAGKHVIIDKPFARTTDEADRAIKLAKEKRLLLTCFQNRRYDGDFLTVQEVLRKDALGDINEAEIHYDFDRAPWLHRMTGKEYSPGDGHTFGLGTHSLDQAYVLFGRPASVTAFFRAQRGIESEIEDSFTIVLQYSGAKKGLLVTVKTSVVSPMAQQLKFWIRGTKGSFLKHQQRSTCPQEESIAQGADPSDADFAKESDALRGVLTTYDEFDGSIQGFDDASKRFVGRYPTVRGAWMRLYQNVADTINGKGELAIKAEEVRDVLRIIELARESHEKGATVAWR